MNFEHLIKIADEQFTKLPMLEWASKFLNIEHSGRFIPFSLEGHEPLQEIYESVMHPYVVIRKAAQLGVSTYSAARALYLGQTMGLTTIYYFPTDVEVDDFVDVKFMQLVNGSDKLQNLMRQGDPNNKNLKVFRGFTIFFRGVFTKRRVKGITGDLIVKDEVDEANQENLQFANDRTIHSKYGFIQELSQPSIPDFGIDASFKKGDQRYWAIRCGCGKWVFPDKAFPDCIIIPTRKNAILKTPYIGCIHCNKPLDISKGQWVAEFPMKTKDRKSYHLSHLIFNVTKPEKLLSEYNGLTSSIEKKNFSISKLGIPYASKNSKPITTLLLNSLQRDYAITNQFSHSYFGMDAGDKCHLVFGHFHNGILHVHDFVELAAENEDAIIQYIRRHSPVCGVVDAMPYKTLAKAIARAFQGKVYIQYFKGDSMKRSIEGEGHFEVPKITVNRTESLDFTVDALLEEKIVLPSMKKTNAKQLETYNQFRTHLEFLIKEPVERANGTLEYEYKHNVPNHFGMALNSMRLSTELASYHVTTNVNPIFIDL